MPLFTTVRYTRPSTGTLNMGCIRIAATGHFRTTMCQDAHPPDRFSGPGELRGIRSRPPASGDAETVILGSGVKFPSRSARLADVDGSDTSAGEEKWLDVDPDGRTDLNDLNCINANLGTDCLNGTPGSQCP